MNKLTTIELRNSPEWLAIHANDILFDFTITYADDGVYPEATHVHEWTYRSDATAERIADTFRAYPDIISVTVQRHTPEAE
jgi:hypothetical protein